MVVGLGPLAYMCIPSRYNGDFAHLRGGGGGGGGGVHPDYFVKLDFEIAVDQQNRGFRTPGTHRCPRDSHAHIW